MRQGLYFYKQLISFRYLERDQIVPAPINEKANVLLHVNGAVGQYGRKIERIRNIATKTSVNPKKKLFLFILFIFSSFRYPIGLSISDYL